jgi:hypothetical protein
LRSATTIAAKDVQIHGKSTKRLSSAASKVIHAINEKPETEMRNIPAANST